MQLVESYLSHNRVGADARGIAKRARSSGGSIPLTIPIPRGSAARLRDSEAVQKELREFKNARAYVRVRRSLRHGVALDAFVAAVGRKWVLLQVTRDGGYFDGWNAIRIADLRTVTLQDDSFQRRISQTQHDWPPAPPLEINLDRTTDLLRSIESADLVAIQRERKRSAIWIGHVASVKPGILSLIEIDPQATWSDEQSYFRLGAITSVQIRSEYLAALASVSLPPERLGSH